MLLIFQAWQLFHPAFRTDPEQLDQHNWETVTLHGKALASSKLSKLCCCQPARNLQPNCVLTEDLFTPSPLLHAKSFLSSSCPNTSVSAGGRGCLQCRAARPCPFRTGLLLTGRYSGIWNKRTWAAITFLRGKAKLGHLAWHGEHSCHHLPPLLLCCIHFHL